LHGIAVPVVEPGKNTGVFLLHSPSLLSSSLVFASPFFPPSFLPCLALNCWESGEETLLGPEPKRRPEEKRRRRGEKKLS